MDFCDYFWKQKDRNAPRLWGKSKKLLNYKSLKSMKQNSPQPNHQENAKSAVLFKVERIEFFKLGRLKFLKMIYTEKDMFLYF